MPRRCPLRHPVRLRAYAASTCCEARPDVVVVGGARSRWPGTHDPTGRGIARALNNRWSAWACPRTAGARRTGPTDTVYLGTFRTEQLHAVGGWDERFDTTRTTTSTGAWASSAGLVRGRPPGRLPPAATLSAVSASTAVSGAGRCATGAGPPPAACPLLNSAARRPLGMSVSVGWPCSGPDSVALLAASVLVGVVAVDRGRADRGPCVVTRRRAGLGGGTRGRGVGAAVPRGERRDGRQTRRPDRGLHSLPTRSTSSSVIHGCNGR